MNIRDKINDTLISRLKSCGIPIDHPNVNLVIRVAIADAYAAGVEEGVIQGKKKVLNAIDRTRYQVNRDIEHDEVLFERLHSEGDG